MRSTERKKADTFGGCLVQLQAIMLRRAKSSFSVIVLLLFRASVIVGGDDLGQGRTEWG